MPEPPTNPKDMADMLEAMARRLRNQGGGQGSEGGPRVAVSLPERSVAESMQPCLGVIDVFSDDHAITVTAETRNTDAQSVHVSVAEGRLFIGVGAGANAIRRDLALPAAVDEEAAFATFRNGILDVTLPLKRRE